MQPAIKGDLHAPVNYGVQIIGVDEKLGPRRRRNDGTPQDARRTTRINLAHAPQSSAPRAFTLCTCCRNATPPLARAALHRMMEAGPDESPAIDVAVFEDHMRLIWGRKQLYGTQFIRSADGKTTLAAMEDSRTLTFVAKTQAYPPFQIGRCLAKLRK